MHFYLPAAFVHSLETFLGESLVRTTLMALAVAPEGMTLDEMTALAAFAAGAFLFVGVRLGVPRCPPQPSLSTSSGLLIPFLLQTPAVTPWPRAS